MTHEEQNLELARRLVACPHFCWLAGMRDITDSSRCVREANADGPLWYCPGDPTVCRDGTYRSLPDLRDPATRGCLMQLVRDAWGCDGAYAAPHIEQQWMCFAGGKMWRGASEAEALVAALEAAPAR